jgi:hypothetical protein
MKSLTRFANALDELLIVEGAYAWLGGSERIDAVEGDAGPPGDEWKD